MARTGNDAGDEPKYGTWDADENGALRNRGPNRRRITEPKDKPDYPSDQAKRGATEDREACGRRHFLQLGPKIAHASEYGPKFRVAGGSATRTSLSRA